MRNRLFLSLLVILCFSTFLLPAQQKSRVAVLPFTAVEAPASEARVVTSLFETALVKTGVYNVIEQNQITAILDAQAFSLSGCTDDACAIEVGKLLAAELIILGELSQVGGRYIANAKIIDVGLGRNVNADTVSAADIAEMTDSAVNLLAYKLAGLTYTEGGGERIADAFGEVFVVTEPKGAVVFINGMRRGTSPLVVEKIPLGKVIISARKDNLTGEATLELTSADLAEVSLTLEVSLGRLFIKSSEEAVEVFFDGESLGPLGTGLFKGLPSGEHTVSLKGDGLFWEDTVTLEAEKTTTVEAYPRAYGILDYELPEGAVCEIIGIDITKEVTGDGRVELPAGSYRLVVSGENYLPFEERKEIQKGEDTFFIAKPEYTEEYKVELAEAEKQEAWNELDKAVKDLGSRSGNTEAELSAARHLADKIDNSVYDFPDLAERADELLAQALTNRIDELQALKDAAEGRAAARSTGKWIALGAGAAGFILSGVTKYLGDAEYEEVYDAAVTTAESEASHARLATYAGLQTGGLIAGGAGVVTGVILWTKPPGTAQYDAEIAKLSAERAAIEGGM